MSLSREGARLTAEQYARITARRAALAQRIAKLAAMAEAGQIRDSWPAFEEAMRAMIEEEAALTAALSANYYSRFRRAEGIVTDFVPRIVTVPRELIVTTLRHTVLSSAIKVGAKTAAGASTASAVATTVGAPAAMAGTVAAAVGVSTRLALMAGRLTILDNAENDDECIGYARVCGRNPCAFCSMLAGRGPVFKTTGTALRDSHGARYHGRCGCGAEPVYHRDAEWPGDGRRYQRLWSRATSDASSPEEARLLYRRAWEGRN